MHTKSLGEPCDTYVRRFFSPLWARLGWAPVSRRAHSCANSTDFAFQSVRLVLPPAQLLSVACSYCRSPSLQPVSIRTHTSMSKVVDSHSTSIDDLCNLQSENFCAIPTQRNAFASVFVWRVRRYASIDGNGVKFVCSSRAALLLVYCADHWQLLLVANGKVALLRLQTEQLFAIFCHFSDAVVWMPVAVLQNGNGKKKFPSIDGMLPRKLRDTFFPFQQSALLLSLV